MKHLTSITIWIVIFFCLSGCNRLKQGAPQPAPTDVSVAWGDTSAIVNWTPQPGNQYFVYWDTGPNVTIDSCSTSPTCVAAYNVSPPFAITGLVDLTQYSVTVNARTEGAKGGPGSPAVSFIPKQAGLSGTWTTESSLINDLYGLTYGTIVNSAGVNLGNGYVAVGNGALDYGIINGNGTLTWTTIPGNPSPSATLKGVAYSAPVYVAVGLGGNILYSSNYAETWTQLTANPSTTTTTQAIFPPCTSCDLHSIYSNHAGFFIAVGSSGSIVYSSGGVNWSAPTNYTPNPSYTLRSITYGSGSGYGTNIYGGYDYVAVGDSGALLTSLDANTWTDLTSTITTQSLSGVTYGNVITADATTGALLTQTPTFVAIGSGGVVLTGTYNASGVLLWSQQSITLNTLTAITFGTRTGGNATTQYTVAAEGQFVAVDSTGNVFTSTDGVTWYNQNQSLGALNAIASGLYDYTAVGAAGLNVHSM